MHHGAGGQLQAADALPIVWQVAVSLAVAHDKGIVHRDLKPSNLRLVPGPLGPGGERVKVLDFGIAKLAVGIQSARSASQTVLGTPVYMSIAVLHCAVGHRPSQALAPTDMSTPRERQARYVLLRLTHKGVDSRLGKNDHGLAKKLSDAQE